MKPFETVDCPPVARADIAWVCVATNDANPIHLDHEFARAAGFRDVVVPAHLLIGWVGAYLQDWCADPEGLLAWSLRFTAPVWPGDRIRLTGEAEAALDADAPHDRFRVRVMAHNQDGLQVGLATATVRTDAPSP